MLRLDNWRTTVVYTNSLICWHEIKPNFCVRRFSVNMYLVLKNHLQYIELLFVICHMWETVLPFWRLLEECWDDPLTCTTTYLSQDSQPKETSIQLFKEFIVNSCLDKMLPLVMVKKIIIDIYFTYFYSLHEPWWIFYIMSEVQRNHSMI